MVEKRFLSGDERLFAAVSLHDTVSTFAYENSGNPGSGLLTSLIVRGMGGPDAFHVMRARGI
jgi:hypothetical protein